MDKMILVMTDSVDFGLIYSENRRLSVFSSATITSVVLYALLKLRQDCCLLLQRKVFRIIRLVGLFKDIIL